MIKIIIGNKGSGKRDLLSLLMTALLHLKVMLSASRRSQSSLTTSLQELVFLKLKPILSTDIRLSTASSQVSVQVTTM